VLANKLRNWSKLVPRGVSGGQFLAFVHFPRKRTLSGWALLFAMGKHTSKEFLYDREHVRVWKCRKTGTKVRPKSGLKRGPSQHPKSKKHPYTGKSANGRTPKTRSKIEAQATPKLTVKYTSKIASRTMSTRPHFSKAGISLNSIWRPIFKNPQKRGPIPKKPNETGNFRGNGQPKKNHENGGQKPTQKRWDNRRRDQPQNDRKTNQSSPVPVESSTSRVQYQSRSACGPRAPAGWVTWRTEN
jgi:hypothetical protein